MIRIGSINRIQNSEQQQMLCRKTFEQFGCIIVDRIFEKDEMISIHEILKQLFQRSHEEKMFYRSIQLLQPGFQPYGNSHALDTGVANLLETWDIPRADQLNWPPDLAHKLETLLQYQKKLLTLVSLY